MGAQSPCFIPRGFTLPVSQSSRLEDAYKHVRTASHFQEVNRRVWRRQKGTSDRGEGGGASPGARLQGGGCSLWDPQPREVPLRGPARRAGGVARHLPGSERGSTSGLGARRPSAPGRRGQGGWQGKGEAGEGRRLGPRCLGGAGGTEAAPRPHLGDQRAHELLVVPLPGSPRPPSWSLSLSPSGVSTGRHSAPLISPCCPRPGRERPPGSGPRHPRFTPARTAGPGTQGSSASVGPWPRPCGRRRRRPP